MALNKIFKEQLSTKCKDFGLTDKALDELAELGVRTLADDASDDDVTKAVDSLVPYAKLMQGEITRKTRNKAQSTQQPSKSEGKEGEGKDEMLSMFKEQMEAINKRLQKMQDENDQLKADKARADRQTSIANKAKELGIPSYLVKRLAIADDADIDKELNDFKQELVNESLMPKGAASEKGSDESLKAEAAAWASALPSV